MRNITLSFPAIIRRPEDRAFLGRITGYVFVLYFLLPLAAGLVVPYWFALSNQPFDALPQRLIMLAATGGASFLIALIPSFLLLRTRALRRIYVFLLAPVAVVGLVTQAIMYREFGTEIDDHVLGLFQGNISALWTFACAEYHIQWAIALLGLLSVVLAHWVCRTTDRRWIPSPVPCLTIAFLITASGSLALALRPDIERAEHYHPAKMSAAPLYQMLAFAGRHYIVGQESGYRSILERAGEVTTDEYTEITRRLGATPEQFTQRQATRPSWLKTQPSHVFFFVMESIEQDLIVQPDLEGIAPGITRFAREGLSTPNFSASGGSTIAAIHGSVSGAPALLHYPSPRALEHYKLDTLARIMKRAHYTPIFLAASHRKFGSKGDSCEAYGYERFTGCPDVAEDIKANEWGVCDGDFFEWSKEKLDALATPHLVTFLNVSNHLPHDAPLEELGEDLDFSDAALRRFVGRDREEKLHYAKHMTYADRKMTEMVEWLHGRYPEALFVFTGDHTSSRLLGDPLQRVPFVLWNDRVLDTSVDPSQWYGTHMDIPATLASLILADGEQFTSMGAPVWSRAGDRVSPAGSLLLTRQGYLDKEGAVLERFPAEESTDASATPLDTPQYLLKVSALEALAWGYLNNKVLPGSPALP